MLCRRVAAYPHLTLETSRSTIGKAEGDRAKNRALVTYEENNFSGLDDVRTLDM
jgi:hypothetical protein